MLSYYLFNMDLPFVYILLISMVFLNSRTSNLTKQNLLLFNSALYFLVLYIAFRFFIVNKVESLYKALENVDLKTENIHQEYNSKLDELGVLILLVLLLMFTAHFVIFNKYFDKDFSLLILFLGVTPLSDIILLLLAPNSNLINECEIIKKL